ncbi:MAG: iron-sulfur cluster assembly scaffold protein [Clostridia bacterium]|nr:iron-sulfur cluster assembly scaffold protein [Clostridia bacterium]
MKSCSRKILELFYNAKHSGRITKPDAIGRVGEDNDGLVIELTWRVVDGVIEDAKFRAFGNPNAIAITSLMTDNIIGKTVEEATLIGEDVITDNLDEFRPEYLETYDMVHMAIADAYNNYLKRQNRKDNADKAEDINEYPVHNISEDEDVDKLEQLQDEMEGHVTTIISEKRGRGRPRKPVDENTVVEVGEKRGRGRPRKIVDETEVVDVGEKRGRGRPKKVVDETAVVEIVGEKRGRGRPRKERVEDEQPIAEKRGRGRPRKIVDETEVVEVGEKRGRGRPRKPVDENAIVEVGEKRGRGRPRKIVDEAEVVETSEKRGRGRPRKEVKYNFPSDLDEVINDKEVDELINGNTSKVEEKDTFVNDLITNKLIDEDDDVFDADYDLFKSNIRNILSGKEVSSASNYGETSSVASKVESAEVEIEQNNLIEDEQPAYTDNEDTNKIVAEEKRGRGRPRKVVDESEVVETGEKRGRGRPRKIVEESMEVETGEKRGRGRPKKIVIETVEVEPEKRVRVDTVNSLTRSLNTPGGVPSFNNTQDIVFASKNVTTTNININVTKTTTSVDDNQAVSSNYSKNVNINSVKENSTISAPVNALKQDDNEIEIEPNTQSSISTQATINKNIDDMDDNFEDDLSEEFEDEIDASNIKDEAPKGGIEDLLKALLNDD